MTEPSIEAVAERLRAAFAAADRAALAALLHDDVRWGGDEDTPDTCHSATEVLTWYDGLWQRGVRASVAEVHAGAGAAVLGLDVHWPAAEADGRSPRVYQVFRVSHGLVIDIRGYPDRDEALRAARLPG
jgi:hypothetical protein